MFLAVFMMLPGWLAFSQGMHDAPTVKYCFEKDYQPSGLNPDGITEIFAEDFSSGTFPPDGWTIVGDGADNWLENESNNAGGEVPEAMFSWTPQFDGNSKFVSPAINTAGYEALVLEFKHYVNDYSGLDYVLKAETTSDGISWNEIWSVDPEASIGPETIYILIDNDDVGSENFQFALTFEGDSYQINYWYIDDIILAEGVGLDAEATNILVPSLVQAGDEVSPIAVVTNKGTETISFTVNVEILEDGVASAYSEDLTVIDLTPFNSEVITFPAWTSYEGVFTVNLTTILTGDENPDNDMASAEMEALAGIIFLQPLYEEFTSSTCSPCAAANPILDAVLQANEGTHSLIKYQMDWPGSGDPYYTEEGGVRKDYYGVAGVPDLYINAEQIYPGDITQEIYDSYIGLPTAMEIEVVTAEMDLDLNITVDVNINVEAEYEAGLTAHIVVVEKTTVANVATNGETEFYNVMMKMLPDANGTTLPALTPGFTEYLFETYNMDATFMEQPNDLAVVVFVQDDNDQSIIQSEMVDVSGEFESFNVTIIVQDEEGGAIEGAEVFLEGNGTKTTNASGEALYDGVFPGNYSFDVQAAGFYDGSGSLEVIDEDVTVTITLEAPNFYWFEMFDTDIPADWTTHSSGWDYVYWYDGKVILFRQSGTDNPIMLVTPLIDITPAEMLYFDLGEASGDPPVAFGTISDPDDPESFTELMTYYPGADWETFDFDLTTINGGESEVYLAWKLNTSGFSFFSLDNVFITAGSGGPTYLFEDDFEAYTVGEQLSCQNPDEWVTWSGTPCDPVEDPYIVDDQAYSGTNSVVIVDDNDVVKVFNDFYTTGTYTVSFMMYIPTGYDAYWNALQSFNPNIWAVEVFFNGGSGSTDVGGTFTYPFDTWMEMKLTVDLDNDLAEFFVDGSSVVQWPWTGTGQTSFAAIDFYGNPQSSGQSMYYMDDFILDGPPDLVPPGNLEASVIDENDVLLTWGMPVGSTNTGYNVYRDGNLIAEDLTTETYTDLDVLPGTYSYTVRAVYDEGLSPESNEAIVTIEGGTDRDMVILEIGTGTWCVYCPGAAMAADELVENGKDVAVIEYHSGDDYETTESAARVNNYYNITGFPTGIFDGILHHVGGNASSSIYNTYLPYYEERHAKPSLFTMDVMASYLGGTTWEVTVDAEMIYPYPENDDVVLQVVLTESHISETWFILDEINFVCRDMVPDHLGTALDFDGNPTQTVTVEVDVPYELMNCEIVAFLQDNATKEVLRGKKADLLVGIDNPVSDHVLAIFPNPANDQVTIKSGKEVKQIRVINHAGQVVASNPVNNKFYQLDVSQFTPGIYLFQVETGEGWTSKRVVVE